MVERDAKFDDIRPYYEEEIPAAMQRIADSGSFPLLASYVYPHEHIEDVRDQIRSYRIAPCAIFSSRLCVVSMSR